MRIGDGTMKKLLLSVFAVALLPLLMAGVVLAEPTDPNEIGLYVTQDGTGPTGTTVIGTPVEVYLVLTRPTDVEGNGQPFISFAGFECLFTFNPVPSLLILLSTELPPQSLDIGRYKDIQEGILEFIVGISNQTALPVVNESVAMAKLTFLNLDTTVTEVSLGPIQDIASIPGQMAFLGGHTPNGPGYELTPMYSMGGSHEAPVFIFNGEAVAVENESFGSVKALFR